MVKINGIQSTFQTVTTGVPQGTILGPLLFILYMNELSSVIPDDYIFSYADDMAIISTDKLSWKVVEQNMNKLLLEISRWLATNKLSLNIKKTVYMNFGSYCISVPNDLNIQINYILLEQKNEVKYLGIIFDSNF